MNLTQNLGKLTLLGLSLSAIVGLSFQNSISDSDPTNPFHWAVHFGSEGSGIVKRTGQTFFQESLEKNGLVAGGPTVEIPRETCAPWDGDCKNRQQLRRLQEQQRQLDELYRSPSNSNRQQSPQPMRDPFAPYSMTVPVE